MKAKATNKLGRVIGKTGLVLKKYGPDILVVVGATGTVVGTIMACKATTKASDISNKLKKDLETIKEVEEKVNSGEIEEEYTEKTAKKDIAIAYTQAAVAFGKLYGPAIAVEAISLAMIFKGHNLLRKRNVALAAAYATLDKGYKEYRDRVVERFGKDIDYELRHGIKAEEIKETRIDDNGNEITETKTVDTVGNPGDYSFLIRPGCSNWDNNEEFMEMYVRSQFNYANDLLVARGHLFLNELLDVFDCPRTKEGQVVGWVYNPLSPSGDNKVLFGGPKDLGRFVYEKNPDGTVTKALLIDPNVDGVILDIM